jgi:hypothetical protein
MQHAPLQQANTATETLPPAETMLIEEVTLVPPLELESPTSSAEASNQLQDEFLQTTTEEYEPSAQEVVKPDQTDDSNPITSADVQTLEQDPSPSQESSDSADQVIKTEIKPEVQPVQSDASKKNRSFKL